MAKNLENIDSNENNRKETEKKERELKDKKELEARRKAKEIKLKARAERIRKKEKKELKRINELIRFPFKTLFQISLVFGLLFFIIAYYGYEEQLIKAIFEAFLIFTALYLGIGVIIVSITYIISENKIKEAEAVKKQFEEDKKHDEELRQQKVSKIEVALKEAEKKRSEELRKFRQSKASDSYTEPEELPEINENSFPEGVSDGIPFEIPEAVNFDETFPNTELNKEHIEVK